MQRQTKTQVSTIILDFAYLCATLVYAAHLCQSSAYSQITMEVKSNLFLQRDDFENVLYFPKNSLSFSVLHVPGASKL